VSRVQEGEAMAGTKTQGYTGTSGTDTTYL